MARDPPPDPSSGNDSPPVSVPGVVMRVHRARGEIVVAACDADLIGTSLRIGSREVAITSHFYGWRQVSSEELVQAIRQGTIVNLLGTRTVTIAQKAGLLTAGGTGQLGGVPHAEIFQM
jgi:hypothetical protein